MYIISYFLIMSILQVEMAVEPLLHHKLADLDTEVQFQQVRTP